MKGVGKDFRNADYIDYLPVNMLATPKEILNSSGYLRSFPVSYTHLDVYKRQDGIPIVDVDFIPGPLMNHWAERNKNCLLYTSRCV